MLTITRSNDGLTLLMSSTDGFCSTLAFAQGELGHVYNGPPAVQPREHHHSISTNLPMPTSANSTPLPTPTATASPSLTKASLVLQPPSAPSPAPTFVVRPGSPTRSNSQSSIATMISIQTSATGNNPTPTLGHVPLVTAHSSVPPVAVPPMTTPPQTPSASQAGQHSAHNSVSGSSVLGKRDISAASESEKEESKTKKRRVAPTLVSTNSFSISSEAKEEKKS